MSYNSISMSKRFLRIFLPVVVIVSLLASGCSSGRRRSSHKWKSRSWRTVTEVRVPKSDVKLVVNDRVRAWINYFTGPGRARFGRYLERSGRYVPPMQEILREHGIPDDVVHIALIESGFSTGATSHASAVGCWQFIRGTGQRYGLRIDPYVDERRDPIKSTYAAANYLADLYNEFGDWYLAFAGYNSGEGKVRKAIARYGTKDFWKLTSHRKHHFRAETKDYVPKFIAATMIAKNPRKYGFRVDYHKPLEFDHAKASTQTDFEAIAKCARADYSEVAMLNPELVMGVTPPGERNYPIKVPKGKGDKFHKAFAKLPMNKRLTTKVYAESAPGYHIVKKGETVSKIARRYRVSTGSLLAANNIRNARHLRRGQKLKIPGEASEVRRYRAGTSSDKVQIASQTPKSTPTRYKVRRGDSLGEIASRYGVSVSDLRRWNKIRGNKIIAGRKLKIYQEGARPDAPAASTASAASDISAPEIPEVANAPIEVASAQTPVAKAKDVKYKVRRGDNLGKIAKRHGVSVSQLKEWNGLKGSGIQAGQSLTVGEGAVSSGTSVATGVYKVRRGDTLYAIALRNNMSVSELCRINNISRAATLRPGMRLKVKGSAERNVLAPRKIASERMVLSSATVPSASSSEVVSYKVKKGDTAWEIARKHNVSISQIRGWNTGTNLTKLKPGDIIRLKLASNR